MLSSAQPSGENAGSVGQVWRKPTEGRVVLLDKFFNVRQHHDPHVWKRCESLFDEAGKHHAFTAARRSAHQRVTFAPVEIIKNAVDRLLLIVARLHSLALFVRSLSPNGQSVGHKKATDCALSHRVGLGEGGYKPSSPMTACCPQAQPLTSWTPPKPRRSAQA